MNTIARGVLFIVLSTFFLMASVTKTHLLMKDVTGPDGKVNRTLDAGWDYDASTMKYELLLIIVPLFSMALGIKLDYSSLPLVRRLIAITGAEPVVEQPKGIELADSAEDENPNPPA